MLYDELSRLFRTIDLDKGIAQYIRDQVHSRFMNIWIDLKLDSKKMKSVIEGGAQFDIDDDDAPLDDSSPKVVQLRQIISQLHHKSVVLASHFSLLITARVQNSLPFLSRKFL